MKANKLLCVDSEVFKILRDQARKVNITPNNFIRDLLNLPRKEFKVGRPPKEIKN